MSTAPVDCVVVGAGVEGSAAAYHLAKQGLSTVLLEQFPLPHSRGSSHGQSRITRRAYQQSYYTRMMTYAYPVWAELERETGMNLYRQTGCLMLGSIHGTSVQSTAEALRSNGCPFRNLSPEEFRREYPMLTFPSDFGAVLDSDGGILRADRALAGLQTMFKKFGGILNDGEPVTEIVPGHVVVVKTTKAAYRAKRVVLAPGPWAPKLLKPLGLELPLQPVRISVFYWRERTEGVHAAATFPTIVDTGNGGTFHFYALPAEEYPGYVKVCLHTGPDTNPDRRDHPDRKWVRDAAIKYVKQHFPQLEQEPGIEEACMYTFTPDENPVIDRHPVWKNIIIAAGFSGHGFKLAPAVGKLICELVQEKTPSFDTQFFRIDRFQTAPKTPAKL